VDERLEERIAKYVVATGFGEGAGRANASRTSPGGRQPPETRHDRGAEAPRARRGPRAPRSGPAPPSTVWERSRSVLRQPARGLGRRMSKGRRCDDDAQRKAGAVAAPPVLLDLDLDVFDGPFDLLIT